MFHYELLRPADAKQATVVLSACVWCLCKRERKTGSERTGVREREGGLWCKTTEKTNRKGCEKYNRKNEKVCKGHSQKNISFLI